MNELPKPRFFLPREAYSPRMTSPLLGGEFLDTTLFNISSYSFLASIWEEKTMLGKKWKATAFISTTIAFALVLSILLVSWNTNADRDSNYDDFEQLAKINKVFAKIIKEAKPAVVTIGTSKKIKIQDPFEDFRRYPWFSFPEPRQREQEMYGLGSGVIIRKDGYILTNNHVIKDAEDITVILPETSQEFKAEIIGKDEKTDIAVIKIDSDNLPTIKLADSNKLEVGEWVVAIGSPFGYGQTVTRGTVSAIGRSYVTGGNLKRQQLPIANYVDFIQTDASINRGNSGGALINIYGELVGINTAIVGGQEINVGNVGIGFAISSNLAQKVMEQLIDKGEVERAWLGVDIQPEPISYELAKKLGLKDTNGAIVTNVHEGTPAEKADFKVGDVIVEFDGVKIRNHSHLRNTVSLSPVGKKVEVKVIRNGKEKTLTVKLGKLTEEIEAKLQKEKTKSYTSPDFGFSVQDLTKELAERYGYEDEKGVIISDIQSGSPAYKEGLGVGDLIQEVEKKTVTNVKEFNDAIKEVKEKVLLYVRHPSDGAEFYILKKK